MLHQTYTYVNSKNLKLDSNNLDLNKTFENYRWFSIHAWILLLLKSIKCTLQDWSKIWGGSMEFEHSVIHQSNSINWMSSSHKQDIEDWQMLMHHESFKMYASIEISLHTVKPKFSLQYYLISTNFRLQVEI